MSASSSQPSRIPLLRRFATFLRYSAVSLSSSLIDMGMFQVFVLLLRASAPARYILLSTVLARVISSVYNFLMNYRVVFRAHKSAAAAQPDPVRTEVGTEIHHTAPGGSVSLAAAAPRYFTLVVVQMLCSAFLVSTFYRLTGLPELVVKILVDACLFVVSYQIQKHLVFRNRRSGRNTGSSKSDKSNKQYVESTETISSRRSDRSNSSSQ